MYQKLEAVAHCHISQLNIPKDISSNNSKYSRVSSYGQSLDIQQKALKANGCEKVSDAKEHRKEFTVMLDFAREGDQIIITRLDRLSRSLFELQECSKILKNKKIDLEAPEQPVDTSNPSGKLLFNIIGTIAEFEREMINQRAAEGRKAAREKGVVFGRKRKLNKDDVAKMTNLVTIGTPKSEIMELFSIGRTSIFRYLKENGYSSGGIPSGEDKQ